MLRNHIIFCSILLLLAIPVYILDTISLKGRGNDWIALDFRGLFIGSYLIFLAIHIILSSFAVRYFHHLKLFQIHIYTAIISVTLIGIGLLLFNKIDKASSLRKYTAQMEQRKPLFNQIQLERWWFIPTAENPKEIHVDLEITSAGRLSAHAKGKEDGEYGKNIFSSDGEPQHTVKANEHIHYVFPLTTLIPGDASDIELTFYLFKKPIGQSSDEDIVKIFKDSIDTTDNGSYFYQVLMQPLSEPPK
ncbi:MAG: hypothetical protein ABJC12_00915 [Saprospiraceae bacterium]